MTYDERGIWQTTHVRTAEKITKSHPIGSERFRSIWTNKFKIRNLYVKHIIFACSLPTSTSTWRSDHRIRPGGYMSGELKSENINTEKAPTRRSDHPAKDLQSSQHIQPNPRKILVPYTQLLLQYSKDPQKNYNQDPPQSTKTLTDCCSYWNAITIDDLKHSLR
jgi:hypothetical protein